MRFSGEQRLQYELFIFDETCTRVRELACQGLIDVGAIVEQALIPNCLVWKEDDDLLMRYASSCVTAVGDVQTSARYAKLYDAPWSIEDAAKAFGTPVAAVRRQIRSEYQERLQEREKARYWRPG